MKPHFSQPDIHFPRLPCSKKWSCDAVLAIEIRGEIFWELWFLKNIFSPSVIKIGPKQMLFLKKCFY